mmetsp:Transcript_50376/g.126462  ORF Transcript_50376/g.126462 Transcript_50376/m.126462 type:complete len:241 (+) Transcript_50376:260-982(+)
MRVFGILVAAQNFGLQHRRLPHLFRECRVAAVQRCCVKLLLVRGRHVEQLLVHLELVPRPAGAASVAFQRQVRGNAALVRHPLLQFTLLEGAVADLRVGAKCVCVLLLILARHQEVHCLHHRPLAVVDRHRPCWPPPLALLCCDAQDEPPVRRERVQHTLPYCTIPQHHTHVGAHHIHVNVQQPSRGGAAHGWLFGAITLLCWVGPLGACTWTLLRGGLSSLSTHCRFRQERGGARAGAE